MAFSASKMPRSVTCYICGRGFGTASIDIHIPQCKTKFIQQQKLLPPGQRKKLPQPPQLATAGAAALDASGAPVKASEMTAAQLEALNQAAYDTYNSEAMSKCDVCGRTFLPDRLIIHQRSCKPGNAAKSVAAASRRGVGLGGGGGGVSTPSPSRARPATTQSAGRSGSRSGRRPGMEPNPHFGTGGGGMDMAATTPLGGSGGGSAPASPASRPSTGGVRPSALQAESIPGKIEELEGIIADMGAQVQQLSMNMATALAQLAALRAQAGMEGGVAGATGLAASPGSTLPSI